MNNNEIFRALLKGQAIDALEVLTKTQGKVLGWTKGSETKENFTAQSFNPSKYNLHLKLSHSHTSLVGEQIFINFELSDIQYFASGKLHYDETLLLYRLNLDEEVYKCDKRKNFRFITENKPDCMIKFKGNTYNLYDISISGMGLRLDSSDATNFATGLDCENVVLYFRGATYILPEIKITYVQDIPSKKVGEELKKIGIQFVNLPEQIESKLFIEINNAIYQSLGK